MPYKDPKAGKEHKRLYYLKNRERIMAKVKNRYAEKGPEIRAYQARRFAEKRDEILAQCKEYRTKNKAKVRAAIDRWTAAHKEEHAAWKRAWQKEWASKNRHKLQSRDAKRRAMKRNSVDHTTDMKAIEQFYLLAERLTFGTGTRYVVDHIKPICLGGKHHQDNLQVITALDNARKGYKYPFEVSSYFNPSMDAQTTVA